MIKNKTKKTILAKEFSYANSIISKTVGLMFHAKPKTLIFSFNKEKKVPLHMYFVFFPIDVVFLDKNKEVIEIKENFKPWTVYNPKMKSQYVIELPAGTISTTKTGMRDKIEFT